MRDSSILKQKQCGRYTFLLFLAMCMTSSSVVTATRRLPLITPASSRRGIKSLSSHPLERIGSTHSQKDIIAVEARSRRRRRPKRTTARFYSVPRQSQMRPNERGGTWSSRLLLINVLVFVAQSFYPSVTKWGVKLSDKIRKGDDLYRLVSPMFLHGGIAHLMTNSYSLSSVGPDVERYFGSGRFLATYLISGIAGNYLSAIRSPNPSLGASGAVFGIVGAYFTFLIQNEDLFGGQSDYLQRALGQTIIVNLIMGAVSPMIDQWGHVGGFLGGIAMAYTFGPRLRMVGLPRSVGGGSMSALIDQPLLRLPRYMESIPEQVGTKWDQITRRLQVNHFFSDVPNTKPWRLHRNHHHNRGRRFRRQAAPNRSVRPLPVA